MVMNWTLFLLGFTLGQDMQQGSAAGPVARMHCVCATMRTYIDAGCKPHVRGFPGGPGHVTHATECE